MRVEIICDEEVPSRFRGQQLALFDSPYVPNVGETVHFDLAYTKREDLADEVFVVQQREWFVHDASVHVLIFVRHEDYRRWSPGQGRLHKN